MSSNRDIMHSTLVEAFLDRELSSEEWASLETALNQSPALQAQFDRQLSSLHIFPIAATMLREPPRSSSLPASPPRDQEEIEGMNELARKLFPGATSPEILGRIESFDLLEAIGSGGMGIVYKAFDRELHRYVAIKILSPSLCINGLAKQRFVREAQAAAGITSPYVVPIHAVDVANGIPFLVMNYVPGVDLQSYVHEQGPLPIRDAISVAYQVAQALQAAHERSVVHRDIKPGNILIEPSTMRATLTDFGLARVADEASLTFSGMTAGTPSFMSPEQAKGEAVDARSDWFSLGSVLFTMLTGRPPFHGPHAYAVVQQVVNHPTPSVSQSRDEAPVWLDELVQKLMVRDREQRLVSVDAVETLRLALLHTEHPTLHPLPTNLQSKTKAKSIRSLCIALAALAMVVALVVGTKWFEPLSSQKLPSGDAAKARAEAETNRDAIALFDSTEWLSEEETRSVIAELNQKLTELENRTEEELKWIMH